MAQKNDLYFDFANPKRPAFAVGETVDVRVTPVHGTGVMELSISVSSRRDFPNSTDFFGMARYDGSLYSVQAVLNRNLREGDGIMLSPMPES